MADKNQRAHAQAILDAAAVLNEPESKATAPSDDVVVVETKLPRIEVRPRMDMDLAAAPPSSEVLDRWQAGIRAADTGSNVIEIFDIIGYDYWTGGGITAGWISDQLKTFNGQDVEIQINSPGGDMFEGIAIFNVLQAYPGKITVKVMALAASAASIIAMAGKERLIGQGAFVMIHNAWIVAMGNRHDMQAYADYLEPFDHALRDIYALVTKQKSKDIEKWMDNETFFGASQSIELGFATKMLDGAITEDKAATEKAKALNSVRKVENLLTKKGGCTRAAARAIIMDLKGAKPDAGIQQNDVKPGADVNATQDAGNDDWIKSAIALSQSLKS